jgi:hypothetical protein
MKKLYTVRQIYEKLQGEGSKFEMKLLYPVKLNKSWDLMESKCQASHRHTIRFCESQELMESKPLKASKHAQQAQVHPTSTSPSPQSINPSRISRLLCYNK